MAVPNKVFAAVSLAGAIAAATVVAQDLRGVIDLHVHCDPDNVPRAMDAIDVARRARERGMEAILLKNHHDSTAPLAYLVRRQVPGLEVFGGVALNRAVGGINPEAVVHMASLKGGWGKVVWMPTADAENQVPSAGGSKPFVPVARGRELLPEVKRVIELVARHGMTLATGHSSAAENLLLVREAVRAGVKHILVTHAMIPPVSMSIAQMKEAAEQGALLEFTYMQLLPEARASIAEYAEAIRAVGPEHCVVSSDLGRPGHPNHADGLSAFLGALRKQGFSQTEIDMMSKTNPARLLGR